MLAAVLLATGVDLPLAPVPPDVSLRGKTVAGEVFRGQARRIVASLHPTQTMPAAYVEGTIEKMFSGAFQMSVKIGDKSAFIVPVDADKLPGSPHGVGDRIRVYGVARQSKLEAYWWEHWLPDLELSAKTIAKLDENGARRVVGKAKNNGEIALHGLKLSITLLGTKSQLAMNQTIDMGDLEPGESKDFATAFEVFDAESKKATNVAVRIATYRKPKDAAKPAEKKPAKE